MNPGAGAADNRSLHELALDVVQDIHLLSNGLAHAGAPQNITGQIDSTTELFMGIAKALAGGPVGQQPASAGGQPGPGGPPGGAPAPAPQPSAPAAAPQMSQPHIQGQSPQGSAYGDLHNTIAQMHRDSVNAVSRSAR